MAITEELSRTAASLHSQLTSNSRDAEAQNQRFQNRIAQIEGHLDEGRLLERVAEMQHGLQGLKRLDLQVATLSESTGTAISQLQTQTALERQRRASLEVQLSTLATTLHSKVDARVMGNSSINPSETRVRPDAVLEREIEREIEGERDMADLRELADQAAEQLLTAI